MQKSVDSSNLETETVVVELDSSFVSVGAPMDKGQIKTQLIFMMLELFQTVVTVSLMPLYPLIMQYYKVSFNQVMYLHLLSAGSCILAYYPLTSLLLKYGMKTGIFFAMFGGFFGAVICCFIEFNFIFFQVGYFMMHFWFQALHFCKGYFVNMYFLEKKVRSAWVGLETLFIEIYFRRR